LIALEMEDRSPGEGRNDGDLGGSRG
jgi:hypothetical protein